MEKVRNMQKHMSDASREIKTLKKSKDNFQNKEKNL